MHLEDKRKCGNPELLATRNMICKINTMVTSKTWFLEYWTGFINKTHSDTQ